MNPPYSSDLISKFVEKLKEQRVNYNQAIILVNNATETQWFYEIVKIASAVCFPKSRVKFYMPDGKTGAPLQGQAVQFLKRHPLVGRISIDRNRISILFSGSKEE